MLRPTMTVYIKGKEFLGQMDADMISIVRLPGGKGFGLAFQCSGVQEVYPIEEVEKINLMTDSHACWCSKCDARIDDISDYPNHKENK